MSAINRRSTWVELSGDTLLLLSWFAKQISDTHLLRGCGVTTRLVLYTPGHVNFLDPAIQSRNVISSCLFIRLMLLPLPQCSSRRTMQQPAPSFGSEIFHSGSCHNCSVLFTYYNRQKCRWIMQYPPHNYHCAVPERLV